MILAIDTSSALTSVAVVDATGAIVAAAEHDDPRRHAEVIGPLLAEVTARIDPPAVRLVACGVGPGPYTGLRVGVAAAIALGVAWQVPVLGLCSLDAVAAEHLGARRVDGIDDSDGADGIGGIDGLTVALDARRREVYWARYGAAGDRVEGPRVMAADAAPADAVTTPPHAAWVARRVQALVAAGAAPRTGAIPLDRHGDDTGATAVALAGAQLLAPAPLYLRRPDVTVAAP